MFDLKMNYQTGDLVIGPDNDLVGISGHQMAWHRAHIRLIIQKGKWMLDPTDGELGSRLPTLLRAGEDVGLAEAGLLVREALEPMDDIELVQVDVVRNQIDARKLDVKVVLRPLYSGQSIPAANLEEFILTLPTS